MNYNNCIYGIHITVDFAIQLFNLDNKYIKNKPSNATEAIEYYDFMEDNIPTEINEYIKKHNLNNFICIYGYTCTNYILFGKSICVMKDNETMQQFKESVQQVVSKLNSDLKCKFWIRGEGVEDID